MKSGLAILSTFAWLALAAPRAIAADLDAEMDKLQGTWESSSYEAKGAAKNSRKVTLTFEKDRVKMKVDDKTTDLNYQLDVDTEPMPMSIVTIAGGVIIFANHGIYKLDGETLTICHGGPDLPTKFEIREGPNSLDSLIVLKRKR